MMELSCHEYGRVLKHARLFLLILQNPCTFGPTEVMEGELNIVFQLARTGKKFYL